METVLLVIYLLIAIFLVAIILLQNSGGGALDGLGGGNSASSFLSARGKGNLLTRITSILGAAFIIGALSLSIYYKNPERRVYSLLDASPSSESQTPDVPTVPTSAE